MAAPTTTHSVTVRKLSSTITSLWAKIKSTFQTLGNLVTAWGSTPSDTKYPSEKLVKTSLDTIPFNADFQFMTQSGTSDKCCVVKFSKPVNAYNGSNSTTVGLYVLEAYNYRASAGPEYQSKVQLMIKITDGAATNSSVVAVDGLSGKYLPLSGFSLHVKTAVNNVVDIYLVYTTSANYVTCVGKFSRLWDVNYFTETWYKSSTSFTPFDASGDNVSKSVITDNILTKLTGFVGGTLSFTDGKPVIDTSAIGTLDVAHGGTGNTSVDTAPTANSTKMVTSDGIKTALDGKVSVSDVKNTLWGPNILRQSFIAKNGTTVDNTNKTITATYDTSQSTDVYCYASTIVPIVSGETYTISFDIIDSNLTEGQYWDWSFLKQGRATVRITGNGHYSITVVSNIDIAVGYGALIDDTSKNLVNGSYIVFKNIKYEIGKLETKYSESDFLLNSGANATEKTLGPMIRALGSWSNPAEGKFIPAASESSQGKYTLRKIFDFFKSLMVSDSGVNISGNAATATTAAGYTSGGAIDTALQGKALASHSHGNISSDGKSTSEPTSTTTFLRADGTWAAPGASSFAYEHTNETNARNVPSSGNKTNHWFNSRNGDTDAASPDNPLTDYFFGNRNNTVKDVVLHADGMMGRELSSGTTSGSFNGNDAWCIKFTRLSMSGMGFCVVRVYVDRTTDADDFGYVDVVMKFHQSDWHFLAYAFCRRTQAKTFGQCRYIAANGGGNVVNGNVYIGIHVAGFNSQVNPIITCKCLAGTAKVELGNFLSELPSSAGVSAAATRFPVFVNYSGNDYAAVGSATKSVYVDATGQIVEGSGFLPGHYIWSGGNHEVYGYKIGESTTITSNGVYCMAMGTLVCTNKYTTNPQTGRDGALFMGFFYIWYYKDNGSWTGRMRIYSCNPSLSNNDTFLYQYANGNKVEFFIGFSPHSSAKTLTAKRVAGVGVSYSFAQNFTVPTSLAEAPQNQPYTDYWSIVKQPYYWQTNEGMGSAAQPVYVNENGEISSCTNRLPTVIIPKNSEWPYNLYSKLSSYNNGDVVNILNVSGENSKKVQMTSSTTADIATINNNYFRSFIKYGSRWYVEY